MWVLREVPFTKITMEFSQNYSRWRYASCWSPFLLPRFPHRVPGTNMPKARKNDHLCPICIKIEEDNSPDQRWFSKLRSTFPRLKPFCEDAPAKQWGCVRTGDCVEGALHTPTRNTLLPLNRSQFRKNICWKSIQCRGKLRRSGSFSAQPLMHSAELGAAGSSKTTTGDSVRVSNEKYR